MAADPYRDLIPAELWRHFAALTRIPRCSGKERAAREHVRAVADSVGAPFIEDARGNALIRAPARLAADGDRAVVAVQTHLDMVCESAPGVEHDFDHDPIRVRREGDALYACGTTLGADNGIGVAAALALLSDRELACGPLELLFTVEEEIGLFGAMAFDAAQLQARWLLNLDSEDDRALTCGSAGGAEVTVRLPIALERPPEASVFLQLAVKGLKGGHSGAQIHEPRANAIKLLASVLERMLETGVELRVAAIEGGSAHNAIPRAAVARLCVAEATLEQSRAVASEAIAELERAWRSDEPELAIELGALQGPPPLVEQPAGSRALLRLLAELPHGVLAMSPSFAGVVESSANLALVRTAERTAEIVISARSISEQALSEIASQVQQIAGEAGADAELTGGYPAWQPRADSPLLAAAARAYERVHGRRPRIEVVHGGLECGVLLAKRPDMEAVSFGPLIKEAHTPQEHVCIPTVASTWQLLVELLEELSAAG
ncbi:MAG TPA: beta-Ala-His dipeptidase [Solirubrobacteraceae bacterium]|nr:beta-Ala-His dipeptidase [Solirubrobacteraceae bacterium]